MKRVFWILGKPQARGLPQLQTSCFRNNAEYQVVAFTATQIPDIAGAAGNPPELAGRFVPARHSYFRRERSGEPDPRTPD